MNHHEDVLTWVSKELDGELSAHERVMLNDHLDGCHACSQVRRELQGVRAAARTFEDVRPPVGLVDRVVSHVFAAERNEVAMTGRASAPVLAPAPLFPLHSLLRRSAAIAAELLLLLGGVYVGRMPRKAYADDKLIRSHRIDPALERALTRWD